MAKKITAPKTHQPSGGRPIEHLAYLNRQEMDYLRALNGGSVSRGPRGLPSFAEETVGPGSSGSGSKSSGSSAPSGGGQGSKSSTSTTSASSTSKPSTQSRFSSSNVMMTDANGVQYDYNGNVVKSSASPQKSNSYAAQNGFPSSVNIDRSVQKASQISGAIGAVKNSPAVRSDALSAPARTASSSLPAGHPGTRDMEVNKSLDKISNDFYKSSFDTQMAVNSLREKERQAREATGLFGQSSAIQPRDKLSGPARTSQSTGITQSERSALSPSNLAKSAISAVANVAKNAYNDPMGFVGGGINTLGNYLQDSYQTIAMASDPRYSSYPEVQEAAAAKAAELGLNYGLTTSVASMAGGVPKNSLGAFVHPASSPRGEMMDAYNKAREMWEEYRGKQLTPEQYSAVDREVFDTTKRMLSQDVSGIQTLRGNLAVEIADPYQPKVSGVTKPIKYRDAFESGPLEHFIPQVRSLTVVSNPSAIKSGNLGFYNPSSVPDPYSGLTGKIREYADILRGRSGQIAGPGISINSFDPNVLGKIEQGLTPQKIAAHEVGGHFMNDLSGGLYKDQKPVGPNVYAKALMDASPSMSKESAEEIAKQIYWDHMEEQAARKLEGRVGLPGSFIREYENRFSNFTPEELEGALTSKKNRDRLGVTRLLRERYGMW